MFMWCCLGRRVSAKAHIEDLIVDITKKVAHCEIAAKDGGRFLCPLARQSLHQYYYTLTTT